MKLTLTYDSHDEYKMRYNTAGDWGYEVQEVGDRIVLTAESDPSLAQHYQFLVLIHELIEAYLCMNDNITPEMVDKFDMSCDLPDTGEDPRAPYHRQHIMASLVERTVCMLLGLDWYQYELAL